MNETILILGGDGYIGWALSIFLAIKNEGKVIAADNYTRRHLVHKIGSESLTPLRYMPARIDVYEKEYGKNNLVFECMNLQSKSSMYYLLNTYKPTVIINLAQMPSAPYSMESVENAVWTTENNVMSNLYLIWAMKEICPNAHLIKMGTMGEYGTPNIDIPEGFFHIEHNGRTDRLPFPKQAGSMYHWAKCFESQHCMFASKVWGIRITDLMQGIVYGVHTDETEKHPNLLTRFDYDSYFGTAINRFVVQAILGHPLTVYGKGGQTRGFINLKDSLKCFELYIYSPPKKGEYRVFNQLAEYDKSILELANMIKDIWQNFGFASVEINHIDNPRFELEEHYYKVKKSKLDNLGFKPHDMKEEIKRLLYDVKKYKDRIKKEVILPQTRWK